MATGRWVGYLVVGVAAVLGAWARADEPRGARWVEEQALLYAEIRQPAAVIDRATDDRLQTLLGVAPGYEKALQGKPFRDLQIVASVVAQKLGTTWDEGLRTLTGGGIVLAAEGDDGKGQPARVFLIITPQDSAFLNRAHATLLELAREDAQNKQKPDPIQESPYRNVTTYQVGPGEAHAIVAGSLVIANGPETLRAVIDRAVARERAEDRSIADNADWRAQHDRLQSDDLVWAFLRLDRLRALDPKKFNLPEQVNPVVMLLHANWVESLRKAPWIAARVAWTANRLGAELVVPTPKEGYSGALKQFVPPSGSGALAPLHPPGTIASLSLWRDLSAVWDVRAELFPAEVLQGFAPLDTLAGQFFGGRDFGSGVLGALSSDWRLVVARQDYQAMDPVPDVKLPALAIVVDLKPGDEEFAQRIQVAFQSFIGIANVGAAQNKAPPLMLGSETVDGITIATSRFLAAKTAENEKGPVHQRHNFSPSAVQVGDHFVLSSSLGLARDLVKTLRAPAARTTSTLVIEADGAALAQILEANRARLVMQNMLEKGNDKPSAEREADFLTQFVRYLGHATLTADDRPEAIRLQLNFAIHPR
jgi:hypothetical protein